MSDDEAITLAQRAAAAGLSWRSGMLSLAGWLCYDDGEHMEVVQVGTGELDSEDVEEFDGTAIKFDDPNTLGLADIRHVGTRACVLECARDRWAAHWAKRPDQPTVILTVERVEGGWRWRLSAIDLYTVYAVRLGRHVATEAHAVVCALEASP